MGAPRTTDRLRHHHVEILRLLAEGMTFRQIGAERSLSEHTVKNHVQTIMRILDAPNSSAAVARGYQLGILHRLGPIEIGDSTTVPTMAYQGLIRVALLLVEGQPRIARTMAKQLLTPGGNLRGLPRPPQRPDLGSSADIGGPS